MTTHIWAVVPAAGMGSRMQGELPKQYLPLLGITMLQRTLEKLLDVPGLQGVVVVLAKDDPNWQALAVSRDERIRTALGGDSRAASVAAGIQMVKASVGDDCWVLVHDAARPLVSLADIQRLTDAVINSGAIGGLLATRVQDTLKRSDEYCTVQATVPRENLWRAQTPQLFRAGELGDALARALSGSSRDEGEGSGEHLLITDEASAMEQAGYDPLLVEALDPNPKITRPVDVQLIEAYLQRGVG
ncbi:MAG: 2-C-methyl-D-erythritol 4-phosphate cytidylyltransferase [Granulosicoccus sp.]